MKRWGAAITLVYAAIVIVLLAPAAIVLSGDATSLSGFLGTLKGFYSAWIVWLVVAILVGSEAALLFCSVDTSWKRLKPRAQIWVTCAIASLMTALLCFSAFLGAGFAVKWRAADYLTDTGTRVLVLFAVLWLIWAAVFYLYLRNSLAPLSRALRWLLQGSVLELLIVVPSHVIVRRRGDCCAPVVTSFGIVTGIAIMLLSFGPGILLLYKKRLDAYKARAGEEQERSS